MVSGDWLLSLRVMTSRFIRGLVCVRVSFLFMGESYFTGGTDRTPSSWALPGSCLFFGSKEVLLCLNPKEMSRRGGCLVSRVPAFS